MARKINQENKKRQNKFVAYDNLDKIGEIPVYYGFEPAKSPAVSKSDIAIAKGLQGADYIDDETENRDESPFHVEEKVALLRKYQEENMHNLPQPVMFYFKDPYNGSVKKSPYHRYADLEIIGASGSIAEAILIQTARVMLSAEGYENVSVEVNSLGDRDSMARFLRELTAYYRKHVNAMTPECRQLFKEDPLSLLSSYREDCRSLNENAPKSLDFLSENSRRHLEEILEYFEVLNIAYSINNSLISNRKYCVETIFAITDAVVTTPKKRHILAIGARYIASARKLNLKKDIEGVGISLLVKGKDLDLRKSLKKVKKPIASFIQLGVESKLLSLEIVERLRQAKIPLHLSLAKDRLGAQVSSVEKYHTPYTIVMGKKEAVGRNMIVRRIDTHAQEIVSFDDIAKHMKKVEKEYWEE